MDYKLFGIILSLYIAILQLSESKGVGIDLEDHFEKMDELGFSSQERVVGGSDIGNDEYIPYQISMQYLTNSGKQRHFCGGSIISPNRILTAAHCVNGQNASRISIVAGIRDLTDASGTRSQVQSFEIHENYKELVTSDIAILKIDPSLEFDGKRIDKVEAFGTEMVAGKENVILTGWGSVFHFGTGPFARYPTRLQKLSYKTITNQQCKRTMTQLTDTEICALERFGKGACNGDSGGPLVMKDGDILRQVGIVSYGTAFCASNNPDVYTRVSVFDDWLQKLMA